MTKTKFNIIDTNYGERYTVCLSDEQIRFLDWLRDNDLLIDRIICENLGPREEVDFE